MTTKEREINTKNTILYDAPTATDPAKRDVEWMGVGILTGDHRSTVTNWNFGRRVIETGGGKKLILVQIPWFPLDDFLITHPTPDLECRSPRGILSRRRDHQYNTIRGGQHLLWLYKACHPKRVGQSLVQVPSSFKIKCASGVDRRHDIQLDSYRTTDRRGGCFRLQREKTQFSSSSR